MLLPRGSRPFVLPIVAFFVFLGFAELLEAVFKGHGSWFFAQPRYWIYPLQTFVCGILVAVFWREIGIDRVRQIGFTLIVAVLVLGVWILPQELLGVPRRENGFDPTIFAQNRPLFCLVVALRFVRLVIVVPLVEEIFWRGFLLRFLISEDFRKVPFGTFSWGSFAIVSLMFGAEHWPADFIPGIIAGAAYNWVAYRTRSLSSCITAHAVTNLILGVYIMKTQQWGFW